MQFGKILRIKFSYSISVGHEIVDEEAAAEAELFEKDLASDLHRKVNNLARPPLNGPG